MLMDGNTLVTIIAILHITWVLPLGYVSVMNIMERWLFTSSLISFFQTLYACRVVLVCEYTVVSPATFKSVNFEFFRIFGFYIKCSQPGFTGARQPDWHQNNPNPSTVHSTFPHGNSSVPICYYGLNQKQRDSKPVNRLLIRQNMNLAHFQQVFQTAIRQLKECLR